MDDWKERLKAMRNTTAKVVTVPVDNVSGKLMVPYSDKRVALIFAGAGVNDTYISSSPDMIANTGFRLDDTGGGLALNIFDHGAAVFGPYYGRNSLAVTTISYIEVFGPP